MSEIVVLGIFVADAAYRADRQPRMGETILGHGFALGPGGKGSNQAVAAGRAGGDVAFVSRIGRDTFGALGLETWRAAGVVPAVEEVDEATGSAFIFLEEGTGNNAIIVVPGAAGGLSPADLEARADLIAGAKVFLTQLEQPVDAALRGLELARAGGTATILNPAPAAELPDGLLGLCDYVTPNETEAEALTGITVETEADARRAGAALLAKGVGTAAVLTLGARGALYHSAEISELVPAYRLGEVVETTGAGDAFNGAFAVALAEGRAPLDAVRFGCATASLSVTRPGAAASMPDRAEIDAVLAG
ncbi:MAG: ribokinase [Pseudomonadota bacterium]